MPAKKRMQQSADTIQSQTMKGPANYPAEAVHGSYGSMDSGGKSGGGGSANLSPPNAAGMGNPMTGSGLPPSSVMDLSMTPPPTGEGTLPPGPAANPGMPIACGLPPGPNADPGLPVASPLPPGPGDLDQGKPDTGITPPGPPV